MLSQSTSLTTILFLAATTLANPHNLSPRATPDEKTYSTNQNSAGTLTYFAPNWPTCGNDAYVTSALTVEGKISAGAAVNVRPDCDNVIDTICRAALVAASTATQAHPMKPIRHTNGSCEGHIMFSYNLQPAMEEFNYKSCQQGFQSVTETCMLIGDEGAGRNWAGVGRQFGVRNVLYDSSARGKVGTNEEVWSRNPMNEEMGFLMGPPGMWGSVNARQYEADAAWLLRSGTFG